MTKISILDFMRYYVAYFDIELPILLEIKGNDSSKRNEALKKYMSSYMKIARTFKGDQYEAIYNLVHDFVCSGSRDVKQLSDQFHVNNMLSGNNKNAKVASSKLIWLFDHTTIIMDNFNLKVLGVKEDSYAEYITKWNTSFIIFKVELQSIFREFNLFNIDPIMGEEWFMMRVFDQYLWTLNSKGEKLIENT